MIRIAAYVVGIAAVAGLLCAPALWSSGDDADMPWAPRWEPVLGTSRAGLVVVLVVGVVAAVLAGLLGARARERPPAYPPTRRPPEGIGPGQAVYLLEERTPRRAYVGTLLHAADRGAATLDRLEDGWRITAAGAGDGSVDEVTRDVVARLTGEEGRFTARRGDATAGARLQESIDGFAGTLRQWGLRSGNLSRTGVTRGVGAVIALGLVLVALCLVLHPFGMSMTGIVPGALVVGGVSAAVSGAGRRRTRRGRSLWAQVGGFQRMLRTPSSRQRFGFSGREESYTAYVPWAVALGCAPQWAQKYRTELGAEPPVPGYLPPYAGAHTVAHVDALVHDLDATVSSALAASAASRRRPSGGGGLGIRF